MTNHVAIVSLRAAQDRIAVDCDLNATVGCLIFRDHQECGRGAPLARSFLSRFSWRGRAGADWHGLRFSVTKAQTFNKAMASTRTHAAKEFVDAGGLIAYATSFPDLYRRAATYVDKILKGAMDSSLHTSADESQLREHR